MVVNEYDKHSKFYKMYSAEAAIRSLAERNSNSYMVTVFACCRQIYKETLMTGCISLEQMQSLEKKDDEDVESEEREIDDLEQ